MSDQLDLRCGNCKRKLHVPAKLAGRKGQCPRCEARFRVPDPEDVRAARPDPFVVTPLGAPPKPAAPSLDDLLDGPEVEYDDEPSGPSLDDLLDGPEVEYDAPAERSEPRVAEQPPPPPPAEPRVAEQPPPPRSAATAVPDDSDQQLPASELSEVGERTAEYEIRETREGKIMAVRSALPRWYIEHLPRHLLDLGGRQSKPSLLDLTGLRRPDVETLRLVAYAVLYAEVRGKPVRIHMHELQLALYQECGLDRIFDLSMAARSSATGRLDIAQLENLLSQREGNELPSGVTEATFDEFEKGSYTRKLRYGFDPSAPSEYRGPDRRNDVRFRFDDASLQYHLGANSTAGELLDMSTKACAFIADEAINRGTKIGVSLSVPDVVSEFRVDGRVIRCTRLHEGRDHFHVAVIFASVPGTAMIKLRRLASRHE